MKTIYLCIVTLITFGSVSSQAAILLESQYQDTLAQVQKLSPDHHLDETSILDLLNSLEEKNKTVDRDLIARGGMDSGGSTLVKTKQGLGVLDLFLYNQAAFSSKDKGIRLPETRSFKSFGIEYLANTKSPIVQKTFAQIRKWLPSSPALATVLAKSLRSLPIFYIDFKMGFQNQMAFIPAEVAVPKDALRLGAFYLADIGVFVDKTLFDQMSEKNQMALLIHEALRHEQLTYKSGMSNEVVQKITAKILSEPSQSESLDTFEYLKGAILEGVLENASISARMYLVISELCQLSSQYCALKTTPVEGKGQDVTLNLAEIFSSVADDLRIRRRDLVHGPAAQRIFDLERNALRISDSLSVRAIIEMGISSREAIFDLKSNAAGTGWIDNATADYNKNGRYFSESALSLRKLIRKMRQAGYFVTK